jgi:hypothetical protein
MIKKAILILILLNFITKNSISVIVNEPLQSKFGGFIELDAVYIKYVNKLYAEDIRFDIELKPLPKGYARYITMVDVLTDTFVDFNTYIVYDGATLINHYKFYFNKERELIKYTLKEIGGRFSDSSIVNFETFQYTSYSKIIFKKQNYIDLHNSIKYFYSKYKYEFDPIEPNDTIQMNSKEVIRDYYTYPLNDSFVDQQSNKYIKNPPSLTYCFPNFNYK